MAEQSDENFQRVPDQENPRKRQCCNITSLWAKYDPTFMSTYTLAYFNGGLRLFYIIAYQDLFKNYYELEPSTTALYSLLIWSPWLYKFIFGILADTVPLFGSRRRNWIILMGIV